MNESVNRWEGRRFSRTQTRTVQARTFALAGIVAAAVVASPSLAVAPHRELFREQHFGTWRRRRPTELTAAQIASSEVQVRRKSVRVAGATTAGFLGAAGSLAAALARC